ncbi:hypothetical protein [Sphingomonas sp. UYEF23]|uniref:hypothetical protein n=1 Tax=Sphingomonas sp. UYEF23 TaxID=1756408 RepID=UPI00339A2CB5
MNIHLSDGEAADMGEGSFVVMQRDEYGKAQSVFITAEDRARMDAVDRGRGVAGA